jgi:bifunctional DNase/RNase
MGYGYARAAGRFQADARPCSVVSVVLAMTCETPLYIRKRKRRGPS